MLFACNAGPDDIERDGGGWFNAREAQQACVFAQSLVASGLVAQRDVCIMSPFEAQVRLIRKRIRAKPYRLWEVNIGPTEAFQGLESRVVILCTTRTRGRFLEQDAARGLGIMFERKRFNVALTRAMEGLIVIGNPGLLERDRCWGSFLTFCWRNELWKEDDGGLAVNGAVGDGAGGPGGPPGPGGPGSRPVSYASVAKAGTAAATPAPATTAAMSQPQSRQDPDLALDVVNGWRPPGDTARAKEHISTLESALVRRERQSANPSEAWAIFMAAGAAADEMWVSGMEAALDIEDEEDGDEDDFEEEEDENEDDEEEEEQDEEEDQDLNEVNKTHARD